jgi:hypothetical protein
MFEKLVSTLMASRDQAHMYFIGKQRGLDRMLHIKL